MAGKEMTAARLRPRRKKWKAGQIVAFFVASIPLLGFLIFNGLPLIISFIGMFCNVDLNDLNNIEWNNFDGFKALFVPQYALPLTGFNLEKHFWKAVTITVWVASAQLVTLAIAMFIATLLHERPMGAKLFQILFFVPYICSTVAVALMWRWIFDTDGGILNSLLGKNIDWLYDPDYMTWCIIVAIIWQAPGYGIVMYKAAFSNVNHSLYEAAALDGANAWQKFRYVTMPGISPTTFFLMQAGVVAGVLTYDLAILIIPAGFGFAGKDEMGLTLIRLVYYLITNRQTQNPGLMVSAACIISWLLFIVTGVLSMILFRMREKSME